MSFIDGYQLLQVRIEINKLQTVPSQIYIVTKHTSQLPKYVINPSPSHALKLFFACNINAETSETDTNNDDVQDTKENVIVFRF